MSTNLVAMSGVLAVEDVDVVLGQRKVLENVSLSVGAGSFTGLIGSNGAGKTTLLRVILGLVAPSSGRVRLGAGRGSKTGSFAGYVPQKITLEPDMPIRARDLVGLGIDGDRFGFPIPSRARRSAVEEMLEAVGASRYADARIGTLSGGEQQRLMIAHALMSRPRLLLLDEPLANLDINSAHEVVELLARIVAEQGVAVLLSAHDLNPLLGSMDHVVYLAGGRAASGTTEEVIRTEVLSRLYRHRVEVIEAQGRILVVAGRDGDAMGASVPHPVLSDEECEGGSPDTPARLRQLTRRRAGG